MKSQSKVHIWWIRCWLIAGGSLAALGFGEIGLRAIGYSSPSFYRPDFHRGSALRPGETGWYTREGRAFIEINSQGLRDREHSLDKPFDTVRVAILGDSYAEALQVDRSKTWWSVLERRLAECGSLQSGKVIEVINFGVSGYGTIQQLLTLRHEVWRYDPDWIVLSFLTLNDVKDNSRDIDHHPMRPYADLIDGELLIDYGFRSGSTYRRLTRWPSEEVYQSARWSRILQLALESRSRLRAWRSKQSDHQETSQDGAEFEHSLEDLVYVPPTDPAWKAAWKISEATINQIFEETRARGSRFLLVVLSNPIQVHPSPERRKHLAGLLGSDDLFYPDRRLQKFSQSKGFPALLLAPELQSWAEQNDTCVHGFANAHHCEGHWNEIGHRLAGERISEDLCQRLGSDGG